MTDDCNCPPEYDREADLDERDDLLPYFGPEDGDAA